MRFPRGAPRGARQFGRPVGGLLLALLLAGCGGDGGSGAPADGEGARLSVPQAMAGEGDGGAEGYRVADEPRTFSFPADHGPHPGFRTEWWYFTGNLETADERRLGYQLTFFRNALTPPDGETPRAEERASAWAADEVWLAHFGLTDGGGQGIEGSFRSAERLARGAPGLEGLAGVDLVAGADGLGRLTVRTEGWSIEPDPASAASASPAALAPLRLRAHQPGGSLDLRLTAVRPPFLHGRPGEEGLSRKGAGAGDASYYYTIPRFETEGTVTVDGEALAVTGLSWLDREWSTSALAEDQEGWDWFALQLDDGRDLMLYQLRLVGGAADPVSSGSLMRTPPPNPRTAGDRVARQPGAHLAVEDFEITPTGEWTAPDGVVYPSGWRVRVPSEGLDLVVTPVRPDQELDLSETGLRYWEGMVDVTGSAAGRGYVELTGYAEAAENEAGE